ncbi:MAG: serine/threonine-protein kinase [Acidobacteriota bacterium]
MAKKRCPHCHQTFDLRAHFCPIDGQPLESYDDEADRFLGMVLDGKYQIQSLIGKGSTGNVYGGKHLHMDIPIAVKILHSHLNTDDTAVLRFRREARSALAIKHPNAMSVMDFGVTADNILYLVMEYINGMNLGEVLHREPFIDSVRAIRLIKQVCLAVDAAHQKNIVHRDLKPDNILIIDYGKPKEIVKVIDFSIAKTFSSENGDADLTRTGIVLGTPQYISPEQAQGMPLDPRSDIYSMGIILYQMLTGEVPFKAASTTLLMMKHIQAPPKPLREIRPEIPLEIETVVLRALSKNPEDRQLSSLVLVEELEAALVSAGLLELPTNNQRSRPPVVLPKEAPSSTAGVLATKLDPGATAEMQPIISPAPSEPGATIEMQPLMPATSLPRAEVGATLAMETLPTTPTPESEIETNLQLPALTVAKHIDTEPTEEKITTAKAPAEPIVQYHPIERLSIWQRIWRFFFG